MKKGQKQNKKLIYQRLDIFLHRGYDCVTILLHNTSLHINHLANSSLKSTEKFGNLSVEKSGILKIYRNPVVINFYRDKKKSQF